MTGGAVGEVARRPDGPVGERRIGLVDLLDRLLAGGVVVAGDLTLSIADVDLVRVDLRALISSVSERTPSPFGALPRPGTASPPGRPAPHEEDAL